MSNSSWVSNGTNVAYEPKEKNTGEVITSFATTSPGGVPNSSYAPSTYVLAASGAWIAQTVATAASEVRRPSVYTELTGNPSPYFIATNTNLVYDADANHITTYGAFELAGLQVQNDASFTYTVFQTKAQTWTSCTLNISRNYASTQWTSGTEARFYLSRGPRDGQFDGGRSHRHESRRTRDVAQGSDLTVHSGNSGLRHVRDSTQRSGNPRTHSIVGRRNGC